MQRSRDTGIGQGSTAIWLMLMLMIGVSGCTITPLRPAIPEEIRMQLRTIGVTSGPTPPSAEFRLPAKGSAAGAGRGAAKGAMNMVALGLQGATEVNDGVGAALVLALGLALAPPAAVVGSVYGATVAEPTAKVEEANAVLEQALAELPIQERFRDRTFETTREQTRYSLVKLVDKEPGPNEQRDSSRPEPSFEEVDSVLHTNVEMVQLAGEWGANPSLRLVMKVQVTLHQKADGLDVAVLILEYRGGWYTFTKWADHNAELFRAELDRAYQDLAEQVVEELFLIYRFPRQTLQ